MRVSVVIRTRDEERYLKQLLRTLSLQTVSPDEVITVNNFSSDDSLQYLKRSLERASRWLLKAGIKVRLIPVSDEEFSHPYSTNLGVSASENELVCITNAHTLPLSTSWLENGVRHFKDPKVACVSGYFSPLEKNDFARETAMLLYHFSERVFLKMSWCSTMNGIIRKSLWKEYPFDESLPNLIPETRRYGLEDYDWSMEMKARGFKVVTDPLFSVYHSHERGFREVLRNLRNYFVYYRIQRRINRLKRPRTSYSKVDSAEDAVTTYKRL
ncbi:glycosyltransferase [Candidatus Bathyarchaeota archaeon]|nr:glycosyltransferase [Candidatus Bathyarchaeota archaeon]